MESDLRAAAEPREVGDDLSLSLGLERGGCDCWLAAVGDSASPRELGVGGALELTAGVLLQRGEVSPCVLCNAPHRVGDARWKA